MAIREKWGMCPEVINGILTYCIQQKPHEACGFVFGTKREASDIRYKIHEFMPVTNCARTPETHFVMAPAQVIAALSEQRDDRLLLGIVHSHPSGPPIPSAMDLSTPWYTLPSHWIISLQETGTPSMRGYRYTSGGQYEELDFTVK